MELSTVSFVLTGIIGLLASLVTGLFWRALKNSDDQQKEKDKQTEERFKEVEKESKDLLAKYNELRFAMESKVNYSALEDLKKTMENLSNTVISALGHKGAHIE